jgi:hypothetical protein
MASVEAASKDRLPPKSPVGAPRFNALEKNRRN